MKIHLHTKTVEKFLIFALVAISTAAAYISYSKGVMVAYNDAAAHLNTARRIIDNLTPGLVQIGSVWLPLLHIVELPFVASTFLWKTGLAGSIVSGISFTVAGMYLYKLMYLVSGKVTTALVAVFAYVANPNLLYMQTTAMFEPLLLATLVGAIYYLVLWAKEKTTVHLLLGSFFVMLSTLTRYDGWAMLIASAAAVGLVSLSIKKEGKEGPIMLFLFMAGFGIFLWLLYNLLIFRDPLYFSRSEFSAAAQQKILAARGQLPTKHSWESSFLTYSLAVVVNNGLVMTAVAIIGVVIYLLALVKNFSLWKLMPLLLLVSYGFNIISLYAGQSVIWMPMLPPHFGTYFNARYGLLMLPAIAFFAAYICSKYRPLGILIVAASFIQVYLFSHPQLVPVMGKEIGIITLQDTVSSINEQTIAASTFLRDHHNGELILVSSASVDAFIFRAGLPLRYFITEGTSYYWNQSLKDPRTYAGFVVFFNDASDRVGTRVSKLPFLKTEYEMVYRDTTYQIWRKKDV